MTITNSAVVRKQQVPRVGESHDVSCEKSLIRFSEPGQMLAREKTPTSPMYFTQSFRGSGNNFYYLGILRIESREKKNEDRERNGGGLSTEYTVEDSSREQGEVEG